MYLWLLLQLYSPPGINSSEYSGTFNNYVDEGCGSGYQQGQCLNGIGFHPSKWCDNKPPQEVRERC